MSDHAYAKAQAQQRTLIGLSPKSSLLQRTCACGQHTIGGGECSTCRSEQSTLLRSQRAFEPSSAPDAVQGNSPAQENATAFNSAFDRASRFGHDFRRIPIHSLQTVEPQTKLKVNQLGDVYEQEAGQVAEQVMRMTDLRPTVSDNDDQTKKSLMRKQSTVALANASAISKVPPIVYDVLNSGGEYLDTTTRAFMEPRFEHDFSKVRVHSDAKAAESAQAVNALAYTAGRDVVFGAGQFSPRTSAGQKLLAHELTHVVQQTTAANSPFHLQRAPDKKQKRRDVVVLGEGWEGAGELSHVLARGGGLIIQVKSVDEVAAELAKIDFPIGTLYFITHSTPTGALRFGNKEGIVELTNVADKLKSQVSADYAPEAVDFRGCSVGTSPKAMNQIRAALRARSVIAGNCFAVIDRSTPITIGKKPITKKSDVKAENRLTFEKLLKRTADQFGAGKECILNRSEEGFFAAGGRFVALWFNSAFSGKWIPGKSVCYKDITPETVDPDKALSESQHCRLIEVDKKFESKDEQ